MTYIIGEIGQNHNGSVSLAKILIKIAARPVIDQLFGIKLKGLDAVKFTKRDLKHELANSQLQQKYDNPHSFGTTYGEHRKALELSNEEHFELYKFAKTFELDFIETLCSKECLSILTYFTPDKLKVASRDLTNLPLLEALAETGIPLIISTGMGGAKELNDALEIITKYHQSISILHCVSEYPTKYEHVNLRTITYLKKHYPEYIIGYSDHTIGIATPLAAVALGAEIIEKHITIDRSLKGTDHAGSLAVDGLQRMVRDIRNLEISLGKEQIFVDEEAVRESKLKLERSIATIKSLKQGDFINENDIHLLSPGDGYRWSERKNVIGRVLKHDLEKDEIIYPDFLI